MTEHENQQPVEPATSSARDKAWQHLAAAPAAVATFVGEDLAEEDWLKPVS